MQTLTPGSREAAAAPTFGIGMPGDRRASSAAAQAFGDLKRTYLHVLGDGEEAGGLRLQVQRADEPVDLWLLQAPVFALLQGVDARHRARRQLLRRSLDTVFPEMQGTVAS